MDKITVLRQIRIKEHVTEESKQRTLERLQEELAALENELKEFESRRNRAMTEATLRGANKDQMVMLRQSFDADRAELLMRQKELTMRIESVCGLQLGEEVVLTEIEGPYELMVGEMLENALRAEIVVKNGVIIDIR